MGIEHVAWVSATQCRPYWHWHWWLCWHGYGYWFRQVLPSAKVGVERTNFGNS